MTSSFFLPRVAVLCLMAFLLRAAVVFSAWAVSQDISVFESPDSASYLKLAEEMSRTGSFIQNGKPEVFRTPGYCVFLMLGIFLKNPQMTALFLQILLSCGISVLIYFSGREIFEEEKTARIAAYLYDFEPLSILYSVKILTETFFAFVLVSGIYSFVLYLKRGSWLSLCLSACFMAFLPYIRPVAYLLPLLLLGVLGFRLLRRKFSANSFFHALIFGFIIFAGIGFWHLRNEHQAGYAGFSSVSPLNIYFFRGAAVEAKVQGRSLAEFQKSIGYLNPEIYYAAHPEQVSWPDDQVYAFMNQEGTRWLMQNPGLYLRIHAQGMFKILADPGADEWLKLFRLYPERGGLLAYFNDHGFIKTLRLIFKDKPLLFWLNMGLAVVLCVYLLPVFLAVILGKWRMNMAWLFILICLYFIIFSAGPQSMARFRHPIMPFICVMAGWGWHVLSQLTRNRRSNFEVGKEKA